MRKVNRSRCCVVLAALALIALSQVGQAQTYSLLIGEPTVVPYGALPAIDGSIGSGWNSAIKKTVHIRSEAGESFWTDLYLMHDDEYLGIALEFDTRSEFDDTFRAWVFIDDGDNYLWNVGDNIVIAAESATIPSSSLIDYHYATPGSFVRDTSQDAVASGGWNRLSRSYVFELKIKMRSQDPADVYFEPGDSFQFIVGFDVVAGSQIIDEGSTKLAIRPEAREHFAGCLVEPLIHDFGTLLVGESAVSTISVTNTGSDDLVVSWNKNCSEFSVAPAMLRLAAEESGDLTVSYSPVSEGSDECQIDLSLPCSPVTLTGTATSSCPDATCDCPTRLSEEDVTTRVRLAKQCIDAAAAMCEDTEPLSPSYASFLASAEAAWTDMSIAEKKDLLTLIAQDRLGPSICISVEGPDPKVPNPARVTATLQPDTVIITIGGKVMGSDIPAGFAGFTQPFVMPLVSILSTQAQWQAALTQASGVGIPSFPHPTLTGSWMSDLFDSILDFWCYEVEVARIRHTIDCYCQSDAAISQIWAAMTQLNQQLPFLTNTSYQLSAYDQFMTQIRAQRQGTPYEYFASWMFEYITANGGALPAGCDMPFSFCGFGSPYGARVHDDLPDILLQDVDARAYGALHCTCCGCARDAAEENEMAEAPEDMVLIPAGSFQMGDHFSDGDFDERPVHSVYVSAFYMDPYEVTKALWDEVANWASRNGYDISPFHTSGKAPDHPVQNVTWYEAVKWCNARSEKEGRTPAYYTSAAKTTVYRTGRENVQNDWVRWDAGYRLPTEAEWEKAAGGGCEGRRYPWCTDTITHSLANYFSSTDYFRISNDTSSTRGHHPTYETGSRPYTSPVGSFASNGYGLYDMAGNVWEWCWDWYSLGYYASFPGTDPRGPASGTFRALRGGCWSDHGKYCRVASRFNNGPENEGDGFGFRAVLPPGQ